MIFWVLNTLELADIQKSGEKKSLHKRTYTHSYRLFAWTTWWAAAAAIVIRKDPINKPRAHTNSQNALCLCTLLSQLQISSFDLMLQLSCNDQIQLIRLRANYPDIV